MRATSRTFTGLPRVAVASRPRLRFVPSVPNPATAAPAPGPAAPAPISAPPAAPVPAGTLTPEVVAALEVVKRAFGAAPVPTGPTVAELWALYEKSDARQLRSWKRSTQAGRQILDAFGDRLASTISLFDVDAWRAQERERITVRNRPPSPATRNRTLIVLRRLLNWATERGLLPYCPLARLKLEKENNVRQTVLTDLDVEKIMAECDPMLATIVLVLFDTGMRRMEVLRLRWDQVDERNACIHLSGEDTKNGRARHPHLTQRALEALRSLPRVKGSPYVFASRATGKPHNARYTYDRYERAVALAGIRGVNGEAVTMHSLRHAFIAKARKLQLPERTVMSQTGHLTRSAYDRYGGQADHAELAALIGTMENGKAVAS